LNEANNIIEVESINTVNREGERKDLNEANNIIEVESINTVNREGERKDLFSVYRSE